MNGVDQDFVLYNKQQDSEQIQTKMYWFEKFNEQRKPNQILKEPR